MVVQHNLTAMNSNRMLGLTSSSLAKSTEKLSSGYKINRAADDAAGLAISEKMRKQIRGLTQASTNAQDGISAVQTAEGALTEVHDMLQRMNELAVKSANGTNSEDDRSFIQDEIKQLETEIDRVSETTKFNETYLLKGDKNGTYKTNFQYKAADVLDRDLYYFKDGDTEGKLMAAGSYKAAVDELVEQGYTFYESKEGDTVGEAITDDEQEDYFGADPIQTLKEGQTLYKKSGDDYVLVAPGEKYSGTAGDYFTVTFDKDTGVGSATALEDDDVETYFEEVNYEVQEGKTVYDAKGNKLEAGTIVDGTKLDKYYKAMNKGYMNTERAVDPSYVKSQVQFTDKDGNEIAANGLSKYIGEDGKLKANSGLMIKQGEDLVAATQEDVDALVNSDEEYSTGALTLTLHVGADATKNNQISVEMDAMSAESLGIEGIDVGGADDTNALNAIETIKAAIQKVSTQRSALGAIQNRLEHTINNLDNVVENTTSAESQIRDTDMATEMVKYSNNNILAQAGQAMLAQANQANQGVLSLLG